MKKKVLWLIIIIILNFISIYAQKTELQIQGKPTKNTSELVGIRDLNGRYCAAIKITSSLEGLKYKSYNGVVKVIDDPGQDLVYVSANERVLEVYHTSYTPTKIILSDYGIKLNEKEVWEINLVGDKKVPIYIVTKPESTEIFIDNEMVDNNGTIQSTLGKHLLKIKKNGFRTIEQELTIEEAMPPLKFELDEIELSQVHIITQPSGADVMINGVNKGLSDLGLWLFPETYIIELKLSGFPSISDTINIIEGQENTFNFVFNRGKNTGILNVTMMPSDAILQINKDQYRNTKNIKLGAGNYKVEITKSGYRTISEWIQIAENETLNKNYRLGMETGDLRFTINPLDAVVEMSQNGKIIEEWKGMKQLSDIPIGNYQFHCTAKGFEELIKEGQVEENKALELNLRMKKNDSGPVFSWIKQHKIASTLITTGITAGGVAIYYMSQDNSSNSILPGIDDIWPPK